MGKICRLQSTHVADTKCSSSCDISISLKSYSINKSQVCLTEKKRTSSLPNSFTIRIRMRQPLQKNKGINPSHIYGNGYEIPPATVAKVVKTKIVLMFNKEHK